MTEALLEVENLSHVFSPGRRGEVHAVRDVSLTIAPGETFGLVGASGSGKSTLGRCVVGLHTPTSGTVRYRGTTVSDPRGRRAYRRERQMIFQDPYASLDPRMKVSDIVGEGIDVNRLARTRQGRRDRIDEVLSAVGLDPAHGNRYAHEFSGGQRQRVGIARALAVDPELIVCDEPISALDVSIQAQVVNLLADLRRTRGLTYLFIAHDLSMVRHISDRIGVVHQGRLVELGPSETIWSRPVHPYTRSLLSAVPRPDPEVERHRRRLSYVAPPAEEQRYRVDLEPGHHVLVTDAERDRLGDAPPA
ncbi:ABC transporter ATP-binding protein [Serinibacter arcticus]|uniref:ABC transporter ATP-binding protein n=1 Tax=Serinibacter arcticus TaxID=1655435 RepID=A0A2U1ZUS6_9MICO|nr:ABC transporter ATP-binding protein [Serinibacter arcticus]PWD50735.1 ABC transporter ATP-binding protein [Serinibacter arcticus]